MKSLTPALIILAMVLGAVPALAQTPAPAAPAAPPARGPQANWWSQAGAENGPERTVWAAQKTPETPYTGVNKPIWHIADILKSHQGQARWEEKVVLTRDFDGRYVQMAPGDKAKCMFYADDRVFGWVYQRRREDDDRRTGAQGPVQGLGVQRGATTVLLHGDRRHRAGCLLPQHARRAGAVLSGKRNADAHSGLQVHQDQDHFDRRL